jgi:hypothetical protein
MYLKQVACTSAMMNSRNEVKNLGGKKLNQVPQAVVCRWMVHVRKAATHISV